ncbi:LLM class flavin-dependent oxidoreductase [Paenibacillus eucommiae]|uniref:FMN-dependent oxidoreductase (Nitrilotriacetate monooxygenase family) n=1 Tax=Paenibacillus eucommiae TaxID=1355755 RepID=A0ABS4JAT6_9BACL|nr:LLM class flavin-dependent oxidoreductase [Paenibacillus eucommiae]MBP1996361.1 FMN-dependent oxidoreductase (nitrilotriacetate monooxygenase family) [Paenibacillus eucommiae]
MKKRLRLNAIEMFNPTDTPGFWRHPEDEGHRYKDADYWVELAQLLERGRFDSVLLADVLGQYDVYHNSVTPALQHAIQAPINDPTYLIPIMSQVTEHLGFTVTISTTYDHPYSLARRISTLDHLTKGRVGWNIVTSFLTTAAKNFGLDEQMSSEERYERCEEYMEVVYKLWETSWEQDAVVRDIERNIYTDPSKVHKIEHHGKHFKVPGIHLCEPSAQRTPVLFQAGSSNAGRSFAARHAECVFLNNPTTEGTRDVVLDVQSRARKAGRDPDSFLFLPKITVIVGATEAEAKRKYQDGLQYSSSEGLLTMLAGWSGIDFSKYGPDKLLEFVKSGDSRSIVEFLNNNPDKKWTADELANLYTYGATTLLVGAPEQIADQLEQFADETGVDGFSISYITRPGSIRDFVDMVVPELQRRGRVQTEYEEGTFRQKLFGKGSSGYIPEGHPGKAFSYAYR